MGPLNDEKNYKLTNKNTKTEMFKKSLKTSNLKNLSDYSLDTDCIE